MTDPALETLMLPFASGDLRWPSTGDTLFLQARAGWALRARNPPRLACEQTFKPEADALRSAGFALIDDIDAARFPLVLVLPPRQREQSRALLARAVKHARGGGVVVAAMANAEGAKSGEADLARLAGPLHTQSKHHCRVFWTQTIADSIDNALLDEWLLADAPRAIGDGRFVSRPGVFAWDRVDTASALLATHLPVDLSGHGADLGCGYGYLAAEILARCPAVNALDVYEADARALDLARLNLAACAQVRPIGFHWHDVTDGLAQRYDFIVSNPPFHAQARTERPDVGRAFIVAAADALRPGGRLLLVANRHLPYESVLDAQFGQVRMLAQQSGFKVIEAIKQAGAPAPRTTR